MFNSKVDWLIDDLTDRRGLKQAWWDIDDDIRKEIREKWSEIIEPQWRDISSAPKDGTRVNLYFDNYDGEWKEAVGCFHPKGKVWYVKRNELTLQEPTHWQPLPSPPSKREAGEV